MAGAGFKTFNTGDVLTASDVNTYLMQQTTMVFADASARSTALGANVAEGMISYLKDTNAVERYDGSSWGAIGAGDIEGVTAGTGLTGGGTSGTVTLSFDQANYGGGQKAAGKNAVLNGDFRINQRSFTSTTADGAYGFDRWSQFVSTGTVTYSAQTFTAGTAPVSGYEGINFARIATSGQSVAGAYSVLAQRIEDARTFAGQTVTVSFWAKAASGTPKVGVGLRQNFGTGGSPSANVDIPISAVTLSTSWARYSVSVAVPSVSGKTFGTTANSSYFQLSLWTSSGSDSATLSSNIGIQNATIDFWGVQVEAGSVATPFQTATGTIQGELAACQRYYWRSQNTATGAFVTPTGFAQSTTQLRVSLPFKQTMRISPTATIEYGNLQVIDGASGYAITSIAYGNTGSLEFADLIFTTSGLTQFRPGIINTTATGGYLGLSAEL